MNSRRRYLYLLPAMMLAACVAGERHSVTINRTWNAADIKRVHVNEVNGSVDVVAGDPNQISLTAHVRAYHKPAPNEENQGYFKTNVSGDTLDIGRTSHHRVRFIGFSFGDDTQVDYELKVPPALALELRTVNGRIATKGIDGATEARSVNGEINLENAGSAEVEAHTVNGRVMCKFVRDFQGAKLKTVNGRVTAVLPPTASFACDLSQVNGDFEAAFPLSIHSHSGSRRVQGDVNGGKYELRISTVNGDIRLENAVPPVPPVPPGAQPLPPLPPASGAPVPPVPPQPRT
jgi:hypothetical protein